MNDVLHQCIQRLWKYRLWVSIVICIPFIGMAVFCWWISPEYCADMVTFSEVAIDGVPVGNELPFLEAGREYTWSCNAHSNALPFVIVDSGEKSYTDRLPFLPDPGPDRPNDRFDPVFNVAFSTRWRTGRPMGFMYGMRVKTDNSGETAMLSSRFKSPSAPGRYEFGIVLGTTPDGWIKDGSNKWVQRRPRMFPILWKRPLTVTMKKF